VPDPVKVIGPAWLAAHLHAGLGNRHRIGTRGRRRSDALTLHLFPLLKIGGRKSPAGYQTRLTGPVVTDGSDSSIAEFPMCRQSRLTGCALAAQVDATSNAAALPIRTVALRHIRRVYCILFDVSSHWKGLNLSMFPTKTLNGHPLATHV
jgi:hypothetical protein